MRRCFSNRAEIVVVASSLIFLTSSWSVEERFTCILTKTGEFYLISLAWAADIGLELIILNTTGVVLVNALEEGIDISAFHRDLELSDQVSHLVNGEMPALTQIEIAKDFLK